MAARSVRYENMVADTDREILGSAFDQEPDHDERDQNDELINQMSASESWDGSALSDEEQMASMMGDTPPVYVGGRPLQYQHEQEMAERDRAWQQALDQERQAHQQTLQKYDLDIAAERDQQRMAFADHVGVVPVDDARFDQNIQHQAQMLQERNAALYQLGEVKMQKAWERYGDEFADRYDALVQNRENPGAREIVQQIHRAVQTGADPGEVIMQFSSALRQGPAPPFARTRQPQFATRNYAPEREPLRYEDLENAGDGGLGSEGDIFGSVWRP